MTDRGMNDEDLVDYMATLSDISKKGSRSTSFDCGKSHENIKVGTRQREEEQSSSYQERRNRLHRGRKVSQDLTGTLELTPAHVTSLENMMNKVHRF